MLFSGLIDLVVLSGSYQELCERVVHEDVTQGLIHGCHLYSVDSNLDIALVSSHGKSSSLVVSVVSTWDNSMLAKCLLMRIAQHEPGKKQSHLAIPLFKNRVPVGAVLLVMDPRICESPITQEVSHLLSKLGGFFIDVMPRIVPHTRTSNSKTGRSTSELTSRQIQIIQLIGASLTNGQIGKELSLSESTIRQETIKIYKAMGVSGREEAVSAGLKLGLLPKNQ